MLRHISIDELRLGMYIHEFCGSGIDNHLWRSGFLLQSEQDLNRIRAIGISRLWINVCKGVDTEIKRCQSGIQSTSAKTELEFREEIGIAVRLSYRSKAAVKKMFSDLRMGKIVETAQVVELVGEISESLIRNPDAFISLARLKTADEYTYMHSVAVCALMIALARRLGLSSAMVHQAGVAGLMHDIGKAAIPIAILNKPEKLCEDESEIMRGHPEAGAHILSGNPLFTPEVIDVCLHHHEKLDGSGYPHRLAGDNISLLAKMGAVCDVYDAITSDRPYKKAWDPATAIRKMAEWKGHFDDKIFHAFVKCVGIYPVGSLVRLKSARIGVVIEQSQNSLLMPKVKVFYCAKSRREIPHVIVDLYSSPGVDSILGRETAEVWGFTNTDQLWSGLSEKEGGATRIAN
ncbi:cyclic di-GMP phosphodiesterase [Pseudomonas cichorii]|uniref:HD-GYP domain-containing protein n=1 Tax=Pseudomonas cichorii TaxID=36746 RepID=UPI0019111473|nr:HD-GYP domain-containing protein [Pseudomonas cichorii]GFM80717.1 cyclic di-GMP phosphodiesterase [Pseudomonas cichorii]